MALRAVYCDLDGTLLGPRGSLLAGPQGGTTTLGARAVEACLRAGVELVVTTGRTRASASVIARLLGQSSYVFELGSAFVLDGEDEWLTGAWVPREGQSVHAQIAGSGAPELLRERFALEPMAERVAAREVTHVLTGDVDPAEATAALRDAGIDGLRLLENGSVETGSLLRRYHLLPEGASKAGAVAAHMRARGYAREETIACGDSGEDAEMAAAVGTFWLVANGTAQRLPANARRCEAANGEGVYEAVVTTLQGA